MTTILDALTDANLFKGSVGRMAMDTWRVFLVALFGLPLSDDMASIFRSCTGRTMGPSSSFVEAWLICGRRAGKSFMMALIAVFLACFRSYTDYLGPGERGTIMVIAADRKQARATLRFIAGLLAVPMLKKLIERETAESFDLSNRVTIEVATANYRTVRGYTIVAALCDEVAFWPSEDSATPDYQILDALRPAMATIPGAMLICASTPYGRRGALWDAYKRYWGKDDAPVLVWKADTRTMNPGVPQAIIDAAFERDPAAAEAEWNAEFRSDVEAFISREVVDAAVVDGRFELPPAAGTRYFAFVDPSGGSQDSMTLAITHREKDGRVILDCIRERRPPFSPADCVSEFAAMIKSYGCLRVSGDRYAGEWPRERFREGGITYEPSEKPKSDLYQAALPLLNSGKVELLDNSRLTSQLTALERRVARGGKDSIDHPPKGRDDVANAVAGALVLSSQATGIGKIPAEALAYARRQQSPRAFF